MPENKVFVKFGPAIPVMVVCPFCQANGLTTVRSRTVVKQRFACGLFCLFNCFWRDYSQENKHYCSTCNAYLGKNCGRSGSVRLCDWCNCGKKSSNPKGKGSGEGTNWLLKTTKDLFKIIESLHTLLPILISNTSFFTCSWYSWKIKNAPNSRLLFGILTIFIFISGWVILFIDNNR